jgi:uncharacterized protein HemX
MTTTTAWLLAAWQSRPPRSVSTHPSPRSAPRRLRTDAGEGVISVAIAVLIMAFLGAAMWVGFQGMWQTTSEKTNEQVGRIGEP